MVLHGESSCGMFFREHHAQMLGAGSAESVDPDVVALEKLNQQHSRPVVSNGYLDMKPEEIPSDEIWGDKNFNSDNLDLLTADKLRTTHGCWKLVDRAQGWGIRGTFENFVGWKRTFVYMANQPSEGNRNWHMTVHASIDGDNYVKPFYRCTVFEDKDNYNPRPKCTTLVSPTNIDPDPIQVDPVLIESRAKKLEAIAHDPNFFRSMDLQKYSLNGGGRSNGIASHTNGNLRADVWKDKKFTRIKARGPGGTENTWSVCNHCGMVYKGSTTTKTLGAHKCGCGCKLASNG